MIEGTDRFSRVRTGYREAIGEALALTAHLDMPTPRFLCGTDPGFVGLHDGDPALYRIWAHYASPDHHQDLLPRSQRAPTIVIPHLYPDVSLGLSPVDTVVHEIGHAYHDRIGWDLDACEWITTDYSSTNAWERFAEAFMLTLSPRTPGIWAEFLAAPEFDRLHALIDP